MTTGLQSVTNFLVPATGSTNAYMLREDFSANPVFVNFNSIQLNGIPFRPSGVIIDNTAGSGDLTVLINEMSLSIVCPSGKAIQMPYPAPVGHTANITGDGDATVIFVDYPVVPFSAAGGTTIPNPLPVTGPLTDTQLRASAVPVSGPLTDTQLRASAVPVSGPLTDSQLRSSAVPVSINSGQFKQKFIYNDYGVASSWDFIPVTNGDPNWQAPSPGVRRMMVTDIVISMDANASISGGGTCQFVISEQGTPNTIASIRAKLPSAAGTGVAPITVIELHNLNYLLLAANSATSLGFLHMTMSNLLTTGGVNVYMEYVVI